MSNLSIHDQARWNKFMAVSNTISDPAPCRSWTFFVHAEKSNVIYKCYSHKKIVSKEELYTLVAAALPDNFEIGTLLGTTAGSPGHGFIRKETDLEFVFDFTCA